MQKLKNKSEELTDENNFISNEGKSHFFGTNSSAHK